MNRYLLFILLFFSLLTSCKKGENDPFISLHSRKARLCGEWKVANETSTFKYNYWSTMNPYGASSTTTSTTNYVYDGITKTGQITSSGNTPQYNYSNDTIIYLGNNSYNNTSETAIETYTESYKFNEDGTFYFTHSNADNSKEEYGGNWIFTEDIDLKKEEAIKLTISTSSYISTASNGMTSTTFPENKPYSTDLLIDELRNKKIVFIQKGSSNNWSSGSTSYSSSYKITTTLSPDKK